MLSLNIEKINHKNRILVADDEASILRGIEKGLTREGYEVDTARDGVEAADKLKTKNYDVVLSDLIMPGLDGIGLLRELRKENSDSVFVMFTGYPTKENAISALNLGAFEYLPKPFTIDEIKEIVKRSIARKIPGPRPIDYKKLDVFYSALFIEHLLKKGEVYGPAKKGEKAVFAKIERPQDAVFEYVSTILPPKKFLLPTQERLFVFDRAKCEVKTEETVESPKVLFGVHPYDMQGIRRLDSAFMHDNPEASYVRRRESFSFIGISPKSDGSFFYQHLENTGSKEGFDIFLSRCFNFYIVEVFTQKGANLLKGFSKFQVPRYEDIENAMVAERKRLKASKDLGVHPSAIPDLLEMSQNSPIWDEMAQKCLSCGACNIVCPTCFCFDVTDKLDLNLNTGERYRKWDACLSEDFSLVAGGEVFREKRVQRIKHRLFHKFVYFAKKNEQSMCVGCGRCTRACLAGIDPMEIIRRLAAENEIKLLEKVFSYKVS